MWHIFTKAIVLGGSDFDEIKLALSEIKPEYIDWSDFIDADKKE